MTIRITGMNSGLDTESIIKELASARSVKVQNIEKDQTKLSWKIDAWKELNSKIYSLYTDVLSDMRFDYAYSKKTTKVSNPNAVSVVTGNDAVNGAQSMKISQLAKSSYLTGGAIGKKAYALSGSSITGVPNHVTGDGVVASTALTGGSINKKDGISSGTTLVQLGLAEKNEDKIKLSLTIDGQKKDIEFQGSDSLGEVAQKFEAQNLSASFVADTNSNGKAGHFVINSMKDSVNSKYSAEFAISAISKTADNGNEAAASAALLKGLGLDAQARITKTNVNSSETTLASLGITGEFAINIKWKNGNDTEQTKNITLTNDMTLEQVAEKLQTETSQALTAQFDAGKGRFVITAKNENNTKTTFAVSAVSATPAGTSEDKAVSQAAAEKSAILLKKLGLDTNTQTAATGKTTLAALGFSGSIRLNVKAGISIGADGNPEEGAGTGATLTFNENDTLDDVAAKFRDNIEVGARINARFEAGRFVLSATDTITTFSVSAVSETPAGTSEDKAVPPADAEKSVSLLAKLGLNYEEDKGPSQGTVEDGTTKLKDLGFGTDGKEVKFKLTIGTGADAKVEEITLKGNQTLDDVALMLRDKGLNAKFDAATKRFFISAKESGAANGFTIEAQKITGYTVEANKKIPTWSNDPESLTALKNLGLYYDLNNPMNTDKVSGQATMINAQDAQVEINGVDFTFAKNTFEVNGLTITAMQTTKEGEEITLTTQQDTDGIYDMIKNFVKKYSELINEMDKLYNAKSASKYEPLTKEEKDAMSDTEVEEWEKTIKESLLRRDTTLSSVASAMKNVMMSTHLDGKIGINDGKDIYLTFFGIETLGYYKSKDNEKNAYHINGDPDDTNVKNNEDKLKKAIANDPDTVIEFFKSLANNLYTTLDEKMARVQGYSSAFTVYNDLQMNDELKKYTSKIETEQKKLNDYVDRWYSKFSQMEVAMAKLKSKESSLSGLFGG